MNLQEELEKLNLDEASFPGEDGKIAYILIIYAMIHFSNTKNAGTRITGHDLSEINCSFNKYYENGVYVDQTKLKSFIKDHIVKVEEFTEARNEALYCGGLISYQTNNPSNRHITLKSLAFSKLEKILVKDDVSEKDNIKNTNIIVNVENFTINSSLNNTGIIAQDNSSIKEKINQ